MKNEYLIGLYNSNNDLVGYFHNDNEIDEHIIFLSEIGINTKNWKIVKETFNV